MTEQAPERNAFIFSRIAMTGQDKDTRHTLTILEYDDHFEVHTSDDPHGMPEIFDFNNESDKWDRYKMVAQLVNIFLHADFEGQSNESLRAN